MGSTPFAAAAHLQIWFHPKGIQSTHSGLVDLQATTALYGFLVPFMPVPVC